MSDSYLKCSCRTCGGHIEFPANIVGMSVACPHCGQNTDLYSPTPAVAIPVTPPPVRQTPAVPPTRSSLVPAVPASSRLQVSAPPPPPEPTAEELEQAAAAAVVPPRSVNWMGWSLAGVSVLLFAIGGAMYLNNVRQGKSSLSPERSKTAAAARSDKASATEEADDADSKSTTTTQTTAAAAPAKSTDDLKVSPIVLRRTQGSTLVYAIGSVHNDSDQQRFGVSLELDLLDAGGKKIGTAKDYAKIIEPRKDWRFRALVVAPKTASVKLAKIREDE